MSLSRREFIAAMAAGMVVTAEGLWMPGEKLISIPSKKIFIEDGALAWMDGDTRYLWQKGAARAISDYFDVEIFGAQIEAKQAKMIRRFS